MAATVYAQQQPKGTTPDGLPINAKGRVFDPGLPEGDRTFSMLGHLAVLGHLVVPLFAIAAPIAMYLAKRKESPFVADHLREAINFQVTLILYSLVLPLLIAVLGVFTLGIGLVLLVPAMALPYVLGIVGMIMGAVAANRGEYYRYPMTIRFVH